MEQTQMVMVLRNPELSGQVIDMNGMAYPVSANGTIVVPFETGRRLLDTGRYFEVAAGGTGARPPANQTHAGQMFFDGTLNKPIWRNGSNTAWVDATGTSV